jgi:hypothetical protein
VWFSPALNATAVLRPLTTTGVDVLVVVPFPSWPKAFAPQHLAVPFPNNAHEWLPPALTATALVPALRPLTSTGVDAFVVVLLPNWPEPLSPQHLAVPSANNAHEWLPPALTAVAVERPVTTTGVDAFVVVLLPSWPEAFRPQHLAVPLANSAHEWLPPALIAVAVERPVTTTGVDAFVVVPFPN